MCGGAKSYALSNHVKGQVCRYQKLYTRIDASLQQKTVKRKPRVTLHNSSEIARIVSEARRKRTVGDRLVVMRFDIFQHARGCTLRSSVLTKVRQFKQELRKNKLSPG